MLWPYCPQKTGRISMGFTDVIVVQPEISGVVITLLVTGFWMFLGPPFMINVCIFTHMQG